MPIPYTCCPEGHSSLKNKKDGSVYCVPCRKRYDRDELIDTRRETRPIPNPENMDRELS